MSRAKRFAAIALVAMQFRGSAQTNTAATAGTNLLSEHVADLKKMVPAGFTVVVEPPFVGYYSAGHHALIMNISTGGGTLVHEIVHPFMQANFPGCPPWFNEGLASLYEASTEKAGHIHGLINWRFKGLEKAIKERKTIPFEKLMALSEAEFYGGNDGYSEYYAQARYLCYYLQEQGLLGKYYREFLANSKTDPTGYKTLKRILGVEDMKAFQEQWEKFVLKLRSSPEP